MTKNIISKIVNIDTYPKVVQALGQEITLGDLHANAIKLIYFLVHHGICHISEKHYKRLVEIYKTPPWVLTKPMLDEYDSLIASIELLNPSILIRLIGDELADRGSNDYFILKIIQKLHDDHAKLEIILSNHGVEFIEAYERFEERNKVFQLTSLFGFAASLEGLANIVKKGLVSSDEIFNIIDNCYKPVLKLIGYSLDKETGGITIYSHAAIDIEVIRLIAKRFDLDFKDETSLELAATIDGINQQFSEHVKNNTVHSLYHPDKPLKTFINKLLYNTQKDPLIFIIWNRDYEALQRLSSYKGYPTSFVHGHDSQEQSRDNIINLDSDVGKHISRHEGSYIVLIT